MANGNTLNIEITSSVEGLKKGLVQADKGLKTFDKAVGRTTVKTNKMGKQLSTNAVPAMTSFSQVVQDAPFGIQGVANNITQLTAQFGNLSKASGGAKAALGSMLSTLAGPAGILLAVSFVTSLLVSYGKEIKESISGTDQAQLSTERLNDSLRAQIGLRKLLKDELSIATSIAVAEAKLAGKSAEEQFAIREKFGKANIKVLQTQLSEAKKVRNKFRKDNQLELQKGNEELLDLQKGLRKDVVDIEKSIRDAQAQQRLDGLREQIRIQEQSKKTTKTFQGEVISNLQTFGFGLVGVVKSFNLEIDKANTSLAGGFEKGYSNSLKNINNFRNTLEGLSPEFRQAIIDMVPDASDFDGKIKGVVDKLIAFNKGIRNIIKGSLADTFSGIGEAIGNSFSDSTDALQAVGNAIVSGLGNLLSAMGDYLIQAGTAAIIAGTITKLFGSVAGVGAGFAAIAGGTILKALGTGISNFGGAVNTDSDFSSGSSNSSFSGGSSGFSGGGSDGGTYVFEIQGTKLIGVLKNTLDRNRALGGSDNLLFG